MTEFYHFIYITDFWLTLDSLTNSIDNATPTAGTAKHQQKRPRKTKPLERTKLGRKLVNKMNREKGLAYQTTNGKMVPRKEFEVIECTCRLHCHLLVDQNAQRKTFDDYYRFTWSQKSAFILSHIELRDCKNRRKSTQRLNQSLRKSKTRVFYLTGNEHTKVQVCKSFFGKVLQISTGKIEKCLIKRQCDPERCVEDLRGRHPFNPGNRRRRAKGPAVG